MTIIRRRWRCPTAFVAILYVLDEFFVEPNISFFRDCHLEELCVFRVTPLRAFVVGNCKRKNKGKQTNVPQLAGAKGDTTFLRYATRHAETSNGTSYDDLTAVRRPKTSKRLSRDVLTVIRRNVLKYGANKDIPRFVPLWRFPSGRTFWRGRRRRWSRWHCYNLPVDKDNIHVALTEDIQRTDEIRKKTRWDVFQ